MIADIMRLLEEQDFKSDSEANRFLVKLMVSGEPIPKTRPATPLEEAQDLMVKAFGARGKKRIQLARQALEISPDCADATVLLAEEAAKSPSEAVEYYTAGVAAGERALGADFFRKNKGSFWGIIKTRPYMRARLGLAAALPLIGQSTQALEHLADMLRLDLDDNLDARYLMLGILVNERLDDAALSLLDAYSDEESAIWFYTKAFLLFRRDKIHREAERALKRAAAFNPFVPDFLLGRQSVPKRIPQEVGFGDSNEAINYAVNCAYLWQELPGALDWLRKTVDQGG